MAGLLKCLTTPNFMLNPRDVKETLEQLALELLEGSGLTAKDILQVLIYSGTPITKDIMDFVRGLKNKSEAYGPAETGLIDDKDAGGDGDRDTVIGILEQTTWDAKEVLAFFIFIGVTITEPLFELVFEFDILRNPSGPEDGDEASDILEKCQTPIDFIRYLVHNDIRPNRFHNRGVNPFVMVRTWAAIENSKAL